MNTLLRNSSCLLIALALVPVSYCAAQPETISTAAGDVVVTPIPGKTTQEVLVAALEKLRAVNEPTARDNPRNVYGLRQTGATVIVDVYGNVTSVNFLKPGTQTNDLQAAARFTNDDLEYLLGLSSLRTLNLSGAKIDDNGLKIIGLLSTLSNLHLASTGVTDKGLVHLAGLVDLRYLDIGSCQIEGPGLSQLKDLDQLLSINLTSTPLGDAGLVHLVEMEALRRAYLTGTRITNEGVPALEKLPNLKILSLYATTVGDAALRSIIMMPSLEVLYLEKSLVTDHGVAWLKGQKPKLQVYGP